jgi:predicted lipid-binding transport protein (Tim44 family)
MHQTRQAAPTTPAAAPTAPGRAPAAASGASRWLGPLAGLAAGGLLASMFMGDGFQGMQIMDFLIMASSPSWSSASSPRVVASSSRNMLLPATPVQREAQPQPPCSRSSVVPPHRLPPRR